MKTTWKRMLSLLLIAAMVLSFGATGYAADVDEDLILDEPEAEIIALGDRDIEGHDVNNDRVTDYKDAQAILDLMADLISEDDVNVDAADLDGDKNITSYDAHLLLQLLAENGPGNSGTPVCTVAEGQYIDGEYVLSIREENGSTNGFICVAYFPEELVLDVEKTQCELDYYALYQDYEKGIVTFCYASAEAIPAETVLLKVFFSACEDAVVTVQTYERGDDVAVEDDYEDIVVEGTGHNWADPEWDWAEDYSAATASFICMNSSEHTAECKATVSSELTEPGCETEGVTTYTAVVELDGKTYTDTKTKAIPATGHTPGEPLKENEVAPGCETEGSYDEVVYCTVCHKELSREKKTIPATGHTPGEPVKENEVAPCCETEGSYDEVVYCTVCHKELSRETKTIPATGHEWVGIAYEWAEDNSSCTARAHCSHNDSHILDISVKTTYEVITEPTTEKEGLGRYTAVFEAPFETQAKDVVIDKIPSTDGYPITVTEYTNGVVSCTLESGALYSGETEFIVNGSGGKAVLVVAKVEDSYTVLPCHITTVGTHTVHYFIVTPTAPTEIILVFKGDANLDGVVDGKDGNMVSRYAVKKHDITDPLILLAVDVDKNGVVDGKDGNMISRSAVKKYTILW